MTEKKYIVTSSDSKIGTEEFRNQATTESGKVFGVKADGSVGLVAGGGTTIVYSETEPSSPTEGMYWANDDPNSTNLMGSDIQVSSTNPDMIDTALGKCLKTDGSNTMTGPLHIANCSPGHSSSIQGPGSWGLISITPGVDDFTGACMYLAGFDTGYNGHFLIKSGSHHLIGDQSGTFTWDDSPIVTVANFMSTIFDALYPVGSYAFGKHPTYGVWAEVEGDRALWLKNSVADGTTISQALPNIQGQVTAIGLLKSAGGSELSVHNGVFTDSVSYSSRSGTETISTGWWAEAAIKLDANDSSSVYQTGANVQPNAYVMKVYKRTA